MTPRDGDDDTSAGRATQGGRPDAGQPGPARRSGNSFWWFAAVLLIGVVVAMGWLGGRPRLDAPAERGAVTLSSTPAADAGRPAGTGQAGPAPR